MKNFRKGLLLTALLSIAITVSAQNNQDSTSVGVGGGFNNINSQSSNPNSALAAPMYCQIRTITWTVNGNTCSGTASQTNEGANRTVVSSGANSGSASYTCSNNNFINQRSASCIRPTPPAPSVVTQPTTPPVSNTCWDPVYLVDRCQTNTYGVRTNSTPPVVTPPPSTPPVVTPPPATPPVVTPPPPRCEWVDRGTMTSRYLCYP